MGESEGMGGNPGIPPCELMDCFQHLPPIGSALGMVSKQLQSRGKFCPQSGAMLLDWQEQDRCLVCQVTLGRLHCKSELSVGTSDTAPIFPISLNSQYPGLQPQSPSSTSSAVAQLRPSFLPMTAHKH
ncbi:hypothetical protein P7K49_029513, partial [Saguinus oedipus]